MTTKHHFDRGTIPAALLTAALLVCPAACSGETSQTGGPAATPAPGLSDATDNAPAENAQPEGDDATVGNEQPQADDATVTAANNADFAALLGGSDSGTAIEAFATQYQGCTIEFDGYTAAVQPHDGYSTRFDYLILAGDNGSASGPNFRFTDVNYYDLHLSDDAPDTFGTGLNIHVVAKVKGYDPATTFFELDPVSVSMR